MFGARDLTTESDRGSVSHPETALRQFLHPAESRLAKSFKTTRPRTRLPDAAPYKFDMRYAAENLHNRLQLLMALYAARACYNGLRHIFFSFC
jgi:hypothetical protein